MTARAALVLALLLSACAPARVLAPFRPASAPAARAPTAAEALAVTRRVADWQLAHMDSFDYVPTFQHRTVDPRGWVQGVFFLGLTELADRDPAYVEPVLAHGRAQEWNLGARPFHADDQVIGQTWLWAYARTGDAAALAPLKARLDAILAAPPQVELAFGETPTEGTDHACQPRWCWSDALFMAPGAWLGLSQATGDPRYLAYADAEYRAVADYLFDPGESLFYRDSRFFERRDAQGRKIFWSRGNGWVFAGLARLLEALPADHPSRPRYEALFRAMAERAAQLQKPDGYWPVSLLAPEASPPETSGTAFFVYGLAWGVNHGLLDRAGHAPAIDRGWRALEAAVQPDGRLGWVQQVGYAPDQVRREDTQLYGVGAFLLAGTEMADLRAATAR